MEYYFTPDATVGKILCCLCDQLMVPKDGISMCMDCLKSSVNITEGLSAQQILERCPKCMKWLQPPSAWLSADLESKQLLAICLKRVKGLSKYHIVDASFIWTEEHSKRVKVKLLLEQSITNDNADDNKVQQSITMEYVIQSHMCDNCHRVEAKDYWRGLVQLRQHTQHKRTLFYLEQLILKARLHEYMADIKPLEKSGVDFFYGQKQEARRLVQFIESKLPCKWTESQQLVTHDCHNNVYKYKTTFCVELVPVIRDTVVCLGKKLATSLGCPATPLLLCTAITKTIHLLDVNTLKSYHVDANNYWRYPFYALHSPKDLIEYMVLEITNIDSELNSDKWRLAECTVCKMSEIGTGNDKLIRTHLGNHVHEGDSVLAFDVANANFNNTEFEAALTSKHADRLPDVVIVKKFWCTRAERNRRRRFKLKRLRLEQQSSEMVTDVGEADEEFAEFLDQLEEDKDMRDNVNIYRRRGQREQDNRADISMPRVSVSEMLDALDINATKTEKQTVIGDDEAEDVNMEV